MTTTIDEYLNYSMLRRADVLTKVVEHKKPQSELYDVAIVPLLPYTRSTVELMVRTGYGSGLAQFKADNALTPVATFTGTLQRQVLDLLTIAEKDVLNSTDLKRLQSTDPNISQEAASSIVDKTLALRHRNINRSRWLAWTMLTDGSITVTYPSGSPLVIDYDLDGGAMNSGFSSTHVPTVGTSWDNAGADIIGDVQTYAALIADDLGCDEKEVALHISSHVWRHMQNNTAIKGKLSAFQPRLIAPMRDEVANIFGISAVFEVNDFYYDGTTRNRFLSVSKALMTVYQVGKYEYGGIPVGNLLDGPVARVVNGEIIVANNPGLVAEMYVNEDQPALNIRVQSSRVPILNHAAGVVSATVIK